jgi:hypothetical protein
LRRSDEEVTARGGKASLSLLRSDEIHLYLYMDEAERLARMLNRCLEAEPLDAR